MVFETNWCFDVELTFIGITCVVLANSLGLWLMKLRAYPRELWSLIFVLCACSVGPHGAVHNQGLCDVNLTPSDLYPTPTLRVCCLVWLAGCLHHSPESLNATVELSLPKYTTIRIYNIVWKYETIVKLSWCNIIEIFLDFVHSSYSWSLTLIIHNNDCYWCAEITIFCIYGCFQLF